MATFDIKSPMRGTFRIFENLDDMRKVIKENLRLRWSHKHPTQDVRQEVYNWIYAMCKANERLFTGKVHIEVDFVPIATRDPNINRLAISATIEDRYPECPDTSI